MDNQASREALSILFLFAASTGGHPGALMAMGYRHQDGISVPKLCSTAALNYIEVAKGITEIYSNGMPQAIELIRLNLDAKKNVKLLNEVEINLFVQMANEGDEKIAAAIGKRYLLGIEGFKQDYPKAKKFLEISATKNVGESYGLLGYTFGTFLMGTSDFA